MTMLPMFPLGTVLFPHQVLALHVFEPRYRVMLDHCMSTESEFGVVLIERGSEVGGGDVRFDLGSLARIVEVANLPDGASLLAAVGVRRLRVSEWLPDDPFPRARVELFDELFAEEGLEGRVESARRLLARLRVLRGDPPTGVHEHEVADDPLVASYQLCARAPLGSLDAQVLLAFEHVSQRLDALGTMLADAIAVLEAQTGR